MHLGAGHEIPVGSRLALTNRIGVTASGFGRLLADGNTLAEPVGFTLLHVGIGLVWR